MPAIACAVRWIASTPSRPVALQVLAEPSDVRAIDDRPPPAVRGALADVELDRVRADVDHRVAPRGEPRERLELGGNAHVVGRDQAELAHRRDHAIRILGLDRHRPRRPVLGSQLGELRHAASDREAHAFLVHAEQQHVRARPQDPTDELIDGVLRALDVGGRRAERLGHRDDIGPCEWERRLHHRPPLLEPVVVDALQALDVHQPVANLDRRLASEPEQVLLIAHLRWRGSERSQPAFGGAEPFGEHAPFPARDDRLGHSLSNARPQPVLRATWDACDRRAKGEGLVRGFPGGGSSPHRP
jgi:hypothetical protein